MKVSVNKESTINTGDYSNVRCGVQLEIDNVLVKDFYRVQTLLRYISNQIFELNLINGFGDIINLTNCKKEITEHCNFLLDNADNIESQLNINISELEKMGYDI